jgi:hypothetical protein
MSKKILRLKPIEMTQEEIQKQIEAVRGLIENYNSLVQCKDADLIDDVYDDLCVIEQGMQESISTLTETLQPYLNGEKLEV